MEEVYWDIFADVYFGDRPEVEDLLTDEQRHVLLNHRAEKATLIIESLCGVGEAAKYDDMVKNEKRHIMLVRAAMDEINAERQARDPTYRFFPSRHDYTKDAAYIFCTLMHFRYNIQHLVSQYTQPMIDRHVSSEPHHPEFENKEYMKTPLLDEDNILEMAIDRISRNIQFSKGDFNQEQFMKFMPAFRNFKNPGQPDVERLDIYMSFVNEKNISLVKRHYEQIFA